MRPLQDWVAEAAQLRPAARAVVGEDETLSYGELERRSNRIARILRDNGVERGDRVAIVMPRSAVALTAVIGVLKAGGCYVPMDASEGADRTSRMLGSCEPKVILAGRGDPGVLTELERRGALQTAALGWLDDTEPPVAARFDGDDVAGMPTDGLAIEVGPDDLAYILFTSGTTGAPKGVPITHANVRSFIEWVVEYFELGHDDRLSGHTALTFDLSTFDTYAAFAAGAELHHVPRTARLHPRGVPAFIEERALTLWFSVPSQLSYVARFDGLEGADLDSLRHVAWCGDVLPPTSLLYWKRHLPDVPFTNLYGPTETTVASSYYTVPDELDAGTADVPIGRACPGEELLILDEALERVPDGEVGDIHIRGVGLSPGYWRDPERTAEAFLLDPESTNGGRMYRTGDKGRVRDGVVHFLGRADFQIKTSGYRVEPAEVEHAVLRLDGVAACAVVPVRTDDFSGASVGCACVLSNGADPDPADLKSRLGGIVPGYMVPDRWVFLDELPVNDRGKVDRRHVQSLMGG